MTDAERLEKWYNEQGILPDIKCHFKNVYDNYYIRCFDELLLLGIPAIYKVEGDNFVFVHGEEKEHVLWVYAGSPEPINPDDVPEFLK